MATHQINPRADEQEQRGIETQVNNIMKGVFRIVFNKWVMVTHWQNKHLVGRKEMGAQRMLSQMDSVLRNNKMVALSKIHLYQLCIEHNDRSLLAEKTVNNQLRNNNLALRTMTSLIRKK
jgi:hypothetical protein